MTYDYSEESLNCSCLSHDNKLLVTGSEDKFKLFILNKIANERAVDIALFISCVYKDVGG